MPQTNASNGQAAASGDRLARFLERSPCPFARIADISRCPPWPDPEPTAERLDVLSDSLVSSVRNQRGDLSVVEILGADQLESVDDAARIVYLLLLGLRARDSSTDAPLSAGIDDADWDFAFCKENYFVSLFAPFYPSGHSRHSGEPDVAFILIQPERGFRRFGVSSKLPKRRRLSEQVHERFKRHGQDYSLELNTEEPKALRYVKPLASDDPPVRWWEARYGAVADSSIGSIEPR